MKAVAWAKENNIVGGYSTGLFGTDDNIICQDFVKILRDLRITLGPRFRLTLLRAIP